MTQNSSFLFVLHIFLRHGIKHRLFARTISNIKMATVRAWREFPVAGSEDVVMTTGLI